MDYRFTADERASFKRCRRQWDFGSPHRQNLEPIAPSPITLAEAIRDALAVYYYPGTWDWPRTVVLPLVHKAFLRSIGDNLALAAAGIPILDRYTAWAPTLDDFAPVKIDHEVDALVPDIADPDPDRGLVTPDGRRTIYTARIDLLAVDAADLYWVVRHQLVDTWHPLDALLLDETAIAACWAWEHAYPGMHIAGTLHNEILTTGRRPLFRRHRPHLRQHAPSGGGRSIPQHRHTAAAPSAITLTQRQAGPLRRTHIPRTPTELTLAAHHLSREATQHTTPTLDCYPTPAPHCHTCPFTPPCLALMSGQPPNLTPYHPRPHTPPKPRPGQSTWNTGRGAAPPQFN